MSGSEDDGYQPWANPAEPFQASGNCGSIDSIWGKQEVFPSALRMHKPVNAELDQVLSVNVGNTVYFQVQASLFSAVAIVCLLSIKCIFQLTNSTWLDVPSPLVHIRVVWLILSLLVLKYIEERRCGVICPKLVQLKVSKPKSFFTWRYLQEALEAMWHFLWTDSISAGTIRPFQAFLLKNILFLLGQTPRSAERLFTPSSTESIY